MQNKLKINIGAIYEAAEGNYAEFDINEKVYFGEKAMPEAMRIKTKIKVMKLDRELNVTAENFETNAIFICSRCLKPFTRTVKIPFIERQFLFERPHIPEDLHDLYLVDMKTMTIDLIELFRQEILLHFPLIPLCSLKCKGLCKVCGQNLNKKQCKHRTQNTPPENKPLSHLKELFKANTHGKTTGNKEKNPAKRRKKTL